MEEEAYVVKLCERYPFLRVPEWDSYDWDTNRYTKYCDPQDVSYYTSIPKGWWNAFGEQMCEEIRNAVLKCGVEGLLDDLHVVDVKEKWGALVFDLSIVGQHGRDIAVDEASDKIQQIIARYEKMSERICIQCGKPATCFSAGWIMPFCDECAAWDKGCGRRYIPFGDKKK